MADPIPPRRVMAVVPHQDDFEFTCGGAFALLRERYGDAVELHVLCVTDGSGGHHLLDAAATAARRDAEARSAAAEIGASYDLLRDAEGRAFADGQAVVDRKLLAALWNAIRAVEPDALFCPPVPADPRAGVHADHYHTAHAVRMVAFQLQVPRAFPVVGAPITRRLRPPVILALDDGYTGEGDWDWCQDIAAVYATKERMALHHESQVLEWLPWLHGHDEPISREQAASQLRQRHRAVNARYGFDNDVPREFYQLTRWGRVPEPGKLEGLFPAGTPRS